MFVQSVQSGVQAGPVRSSLQSGIGPALISSYDCRPYTSGAEETCDFVVPANRSTAFIAVHGYTDGEFTVTVTATAPPTASDHDAPTEQDGAAPPLSATTFMQQEEGPRASAVDAGAVTARS